MLKPGDKVLHRFNSELGPGEIQAVSGGRMKIFFPRSDATLEFLNNYQNAIKEIARVTKPHGKFVALILNPDSEYFTNEILKPGDYFNRMKHLDVWAIRHFASTLFTITKTEYFLGIKGRLVFDTADTKYASIFIIVGIRN